MRKPLLSRVMTLDAATIDELYGLEPVFEPGDHAAATSELGVFVELQCPWCGEPYGSMLDLTESSRSYIEDCQVCCRGEARGQRARRARAGFDEPGRLSDAFRVRPRETSSSPPELRDEKSSVRAASVMMATAGCLIRRSVEMA